MRRADRRNAVPAGLAALALVVPLTLVGIAGLTETTRDGTHDAGNASGVGPLLADVVGDSMAPPVASTTLLSLSSSIAVLGSPVTARVQVTGGSPTGSAQVLVDGTSVATVPLAADGTATVRLPADVATGRFTVTAVYGGAPTAAPPVLGSTSAAASLTVTRAVPTVRTDGTDWTVRRGDPKDVQVRVAGVDGVTPTGTVDVWVNGVRKATAALDPRGAAVVTLPKGTRASLVIVTFAGDPTYLPWIATPRLLVVR